MRGADSRTGKNNQGSQVLVDLAGLSVFPEEATEDTLAAHPLDLGRHTGLSGTLALTGTSVTTFSLRSKEVAGASAGVNSGGLDNDMTVLDQLLDVSTRVGVRDFRLFCWVEPDFAFADAGDGCGEPLLRSKVNHRRWCSAV